MSINNNDAVKSTIYALLYSNEAFARCPKCNKYICYFEAYNCHCSICGKFEYDKMIIVYLGDE